MTRTGDARRSDSGSAGGASSTSRPWRCSPDVTARRLGENIVLVHLGTDRIYELNPTAARIWELIQTGETGGGVV